MLTLSPIIFSVLICQCYSISTTVRKVIEGSQVTLQCRIPSRQMLADVTLDSSSGSVMPVIWLRFDMKDPSNHLLISHEDTLLIDNPRLTVSFDEQTGRSILTINEAQHQDSGSYQCQVPIGNEVVSSSSIEVIIESSNRKPMESAKSAASNSVKWPFAINWLIAVTVIMILY